MTMFLVNVPLVTVKEINGSGSLTAKALKYLPRFTLSSITDGHLVNIRMVGVRFGTSKLLPELNISCG